MTTAEMIDALILQFLQNCNDPKQSAFLEAHRRTTKQLPIADQKHKMAYLVVVTENRIVVYDEVEDEFGIAQLSRELCQIHQVELVGTFSQALQEMLRRIEM